MRARTSVRKENRQLNSATGFYRVLIVLLSSVYFVFTSVDGMDMTPASELTAEIKFTRDAKTDLAWSGGVYNALQGVKVANCSWIKYRNMSEFPMCLDPIDLGVSKAVQRDLYYQDCELLPNLYKYQAHKHKRSGVHLEIGANIGACMMEMLTMTKARIIAFEPNPLNLYRLTQTLNALAPEIKGRVTLYPFGVGNSTMNSFIYTAEWNKGNSVVGLEVKDNDNQRMIAPLKVEIRKLDDMGLLLSRHMNSDILSVKMDVQGYECRVVVGGLQVFRNIPVMKTEVAAKWLHKQGCSDKELRRLLIDDVQFKVFITPDNFVNLDYYDLIAICDIKDEKGIRHIVANSTHRLNVFR